VSINRERDGEIAELVRRAKIGDPKAFDLMVDHYTPNLYRVVRRLASDQGEAEEIVQEAWLRAWRAFSRYKDDRPLINWLIRIAVNVARDRWRKKKPLDFADLSDSEVDVPDLDPGPEEKLTRKETLERLVNGVERLPPKHRMVVALRYDAGHSYKEIADILGVPINTVRTHLHRAKSALRIWMEVEDE